MAGTYDPFSGRQNSSPSRRRRGGPTLEDFEALAAAYQEVQTRYTEATKTLEETKQQFQIKDEALQLQKADIQRLEAENVWTKAALEQTQKQLEEAQSSNEEEQQWQERYTRLQAEANNVRKRLEQRFADETIDARNRVLTDMIPLADHLELALQYAENQSEDPDIAESGFFKRFVGNIEATQQAFLSALRRYDIEPIDANGKPFDPSLHEAVGQMPSDEVPADHVAQVVQTGYVNGDKLLRPSRVLVSGG